MDVITIEPAQSSAPTTYRNERPYPFCPGCGHAMILNQVNAGLTKLALDPHQVVLVSDIGCVGLSDQYFATNAFHGLHGRSVAYATGIKLANPDLKVIVFIGDGGTGIGGHHLINAARRNVDVTVLVFNNMNFGMTGGEHSVTTPEGARTATTRDGNPEHPLDIAKTVAVNGAGYVWRGTTFDKELPDRIAEAIEHPGFALLDIWELCTAYFVPNNHFSKKLLMDTQTRMGLEQGLIQIQERPEFGQRMQALITKHQGEETLPIRSLPTLFSSQLTQPYRLVVAGKAGGKVRSSARTVAAAGVLSGLWATQRDDYPVTIMTGHSISEIILSPEEVMFTGISKPDTLIIVAEEGRKKVGHFLERMDASDRVFVTPAFVDVPTRAQKIVVDPKGAGIRVTRTNETALVLFAVMRYLNIYPPDALAEAIRRTQRPAIAEQNLAVLDAVLQADFAHLFPTAK